MVEDIEIIKTEILQKIADIKEFPQGAHNLRLNGKGVERVNSENIEIVPKENGTGIDIYVKPNTKNESAYIPVILTEGGLNDEVYNDFHIGENADVVIVAGCGIHNHTQHDSSHNGIHTFYLEKGARVKYVEKHYGHGQSVGKKNLSPLTQVFLDEGATMIMDTLQLEGVDYAIRTTKGELKNKATFIVNEKILTQKTQFASSVFDVKLIGAGASTKITSRAVAKDESNQEFHSNVTGTCECFGHVECDAILMNKAQIVAIPQISALSSDARLIHEATIGKIAGAQLEKLLTLGLSEKEAEDFIINGFLS